MEYGLDADEDIKAAVINAKTDKFQQGVIFQGAISSQSLIQSHGLINVSNGLEQHRTLNSDRPKRVYLTKQLYEKLLKQKATSAINKCGNFGFISESYVYFKK
ncbi:unnamed protein product [Rotaria sp. Silwood1]|nr:unnamed protein product [Rotaria sp. Silwood1]